MERPCNSGRVSGSVGILSRARSWCLRNEDARPQQVGGNEVAAGRTLSIPFHRVQAFQLACSAHPSGQFKVHVLAHPDLDWPVSGGGSRARAAFLAPKPVRAMRRTWSPSRAWQLKFHFSRKPVASTRYDITVKYTNGCIQ